MVKYKNLIENRGISLKGSGVNSFALSKSLSFEVMEKLFEEQIAILGGDVYQLKNGKPKLTYDNWYCDRRESESMEDYVARSIAEAKIYIENYTDDSAIFALVLND